MRKIFAIFCLMWLQYSANAKPLIATSTKPLAAIVKMVVQDEFDVVAIQGDSGCPHNFHSKPSDIAKLRQASMVIYIDDNFENFMPLLTKGLESKILKLSSFPELQLSSTNLHIWSDLRKIEAVTEILYSEIKSRFPDPASKLMNNKNIVKNQLQELMQITEEKLRNINSVIITSDSLEGFFANSDIEVVRLYWQADHASLKDYDIIRKTAKEKPDSCIVIDITQSSSLESLYNKLGRKVVKFDSENWQIDAQDMYSFSNYYKTQIEKLVDCK